MKRNIKNFIIFMVAMFITVTGFLTVHAAEPEEATGTGTLEGTIPTNIFQIVLPADVDEVFDFILDPQELINETDGAAYGGKKFEKDATLFFKRTDDETGNDYSSISDAITIINKSSVPVDVTLTAKISPDSLGGITMTDDEAFTDDTRASLYLAVTDGENTVPIPEEEGTSIQVTIPAAEDAYEYRYNSEKDQYIYGLKGDLSGIEFPEYSFRLTGAANRSGDWQGIGNAKPEVVVTWVVTPVEREEEELPDQNPEEKETAGAASDDASESGESLSNDENSAVVSGNTEDASEEMFSDVIKKEEEPLTKSEEADTDTDILSEEGVLSEETVSEKEVTSEGGEEEPEAETADSLLLEE